MKKKKIAALLVAILAIATTFSGCANESAPTANTETTTAETIAGEETGSTEATETTPADDSGMEVGDLTLEFESCYPFQDGYALVKEQLNDGKWGMIDTKGNLVIDFMYDGIYYYSDDLACVSKDGD